MEIHFLHNGKFFLYYFTNDFFFSIFSVVTSASFCISYYLDVGPLWSSNFLNFSLLFSIFWFYLFIYFFALLSVRFSYLIIHPFYLFVFVFAIMFLTSKGFVCVCASSECSFFFFFYIILFSFHKFNTNFSSLMIFMVVFSGSKEFYSPCIAFNYFFVLIFIFQS